jgi:pimeloyl-ACP methyl ester carboxylesterase
MRAHSGERGVSVTTVRGHGVDLAVQVTGPCVAPAIVVGHGVASTSRFVRAAFAGPLVAAGWRLVSYDLRGHGDSTPLADPAEHRLERHVDDLAAVVEATGAVAVGGVSLGGHVAVAWAADGGMPRAVLACLPAWTGRAVPGQGAHAAVARELAGGGVGAMISRFRTDTAMEPWLRETLLADWPAHDRESLAAGLTALDGGLAPTELELRSLPCPLALVTWPDDPGHPLAVARAWSDWAPRSALDVIGLSDLAAGPEPLGRAALRALDALGVGP